MDQEVTGLLNRRKYVKTILGGGAKKVEADVSVTDTIRVRDRNKLRAKQASRTGTECIAKERQLQQLLNVRHEKGLLPRACRRACTEYDSAHPTT